MRRCEPKPVRFFWTGCESPQDLPLFAGRLRMLTKLFQQILVGFDILTYRKGRRPRVPRKRFGPYQTRLGGTATHYLLADQEVRLLKGKLRLRQITRLAEDGHQTPILTSRRDLPAAQVAYWMFNRWRQENFFKYLRDEYALDALADH